MSQNKVSPNLQAKKAVGQDLETESNGAKHIGDSNSHLTNGSITEVSVEIGDSVTSTIISIDIQGAHDKAKDPSIEHNNTTNETMKSHNVDLVGSHELSMDDEKDQTLDKETEKREIKTKDLSSCRDLISGSATIVTQIVTTLLAETGGKKHLSLSPGTSISGPPNVVENEQNVHYTDGDEDDVNILGKIDKSTVVTNDDLDMATQPTQQSLINSHSVTGDKTKLMDPSLVPITHNDKQTKIEHINHIKITKEREKKTLDCEDHHHNKPIQTELVTIKSNSIQSLTSSHPLQKDIREGTPRHKTKYMQYT